MTTALVGATIIDGNGGPPMPDSTIVIENERISALGPSSQISVSEGTKVIDTKGKTIIPGLNDGHTHICGEAYPDPAYPLKDLPAYAPIRGVHAARTMLDMGFTACRAMADSFYSNVALKQAVDLGIVPGPRMLVSGMMVGIIGGGASGYLPPDRYKVDEAMFSGPHDARRAVRVQILNGADFIETMVGGRVGSNARTLPEDNEWTEAELEAAADETHNRGRRIGANCYSDETVEACVLAGFDIIEHGCMVTEKGIATMVDNGVFMVPTLCAYYAYLAPDAEQHYPNYRLARGRKVAGALRENFPKYIEMGLKVAGGSDGIGPGSGRRPGEGAKELELMVEFGMTPMQAIVANTKVGADVMGLLNEFGTLEPGKLADLILIDGDPLSDISLLQKREKIQLVMKGGELFRSDL